MLLKVQCIFTSNVPTLDDNIENSILTCDRNERHIISTVVEHYYRSNHGRLVSEARAYKLKGLILRDRLWLFLMEYDMDMPRQGD